MHYRRPRIEVRNSKGLLKMVCVLTNRAEENPGQKGGEGPDLILYSPIEARRRAQQREQTINMSR